MKRTIPTRHHCILLILAFLATAGLFAAAATRLGAAEATPPSNMQQIEITVIHVDQYAVYAPNRVFYFDNRMDKRKITSMSRTADHLRNRKAMITFSSTGDQDKHLYLVDIVPAGEKQLADRQAPPTREARETASTQQDRTARAYSDETASPPADVPAQSRDSAWQTAPREKAPRRQEMEMRTPSAAPEERTARVPANSATAPPVNDPGELRTPPRQPLPQERTQAPGSRVETRTPSAAPEERTARTPVNSGAAPPVNDPVEVRTLPKQALPPERTQPRGPELPQSITRQEITAFVRNILELNGKKDLSNVLPFYADKVDYYDRGVVTRDYIRRDLGYYFQNWDSISTDLDGDVVMIVLDQPEERTAKFISRFSVRNEKKAVAGRTENIWRIQRINGQLRLVGVKQRIISRDR